MTDILSPQKVREAQKVVNQIALAYKQSADDYEIEALAPKWWRRLAARWAGYIMNGTLDLDTIRESFTIACSRTAIGLVDNDSTFQYAAGIVRNKHFNAQDVEDHR